MDQTMSKILNVIFILQVYLDLLLLVEMYILEVPVGYQIQYVSQSTIYNNSIWIGLYAMKLYHQVQIIQLCTLLRTRIE